MATEEDNFDIDIYGDGGDDYQEEGQVNGDEGIQSAIIKPASPPDSSVPAPTTFVDTAEAAANGHESHGGNTLPDDQNNTDNVAHKIGSTDESSLDSLHLPKQAPQTQGLKRKEGADDRFVDPGATTALFITDLPWWITDDDVRGWANQSECEDELEDMTFSEHKVNGKSKGQAYILFKSPQAATAAKHKIESFGEGQKYRQKFSVSYTNPYTNPFKTLPKDGPMRSGNQSSRSTSTGYTNPGGMSGGPPQQSGYPSSGGYRGRGGYNNRGSASNGGGYARSGFQQPIAGNFQPPVMNGFQAAPMGAMPSYGGFQNRGGMMSGMRGNSMGVMRGGRGGMSNGMNGMMGMPLGGMNMGGMSGQMGGMAMGMPQMGVGMGMQGMPGYFTSASIDHNPSSTWLPPPNVWQGNSMGPSQSIGPAAYPHATASGAYYGVQPIGHQFVEAKHGPDEGSMLKRESSVLGSPGFQGAQPHYNPAFFPPQGVQGGGMGDTSWNPHGAKRTRQE